MKNIFVGNLNFGATEDAVRSMFEAYGTVEKVNLITDRDTGQPRGFGFVEMSVNADADRAIAELNGRELDGRALNVNEARPKTDRGGSGGGGGGGRRKQSLVADLSRGAVPFSAAPLPLKSFRVSNLPTASLPGSPWRIALEHYQARS